MEGVGPGSVLGGRYTVGRLVRDDAGAQRWTADEPDLGRSVSLLVLPAQDGRAEALLDAARVAAGLDIPGCVRVLDIGAEGPVVWVVEESLADARSVTDLLHDGGLPGDEVRRIVGEAATALDAAAARGVHHLRVTPDEVFRTADGDVKVRGLATEAALHGADEGGEAAATTDAVCLVSLAYAGLTGLWPLQDLSCGLPPAPRLVHGVAAPSEIAAGVPRDLDAQCRLTLGGRGGPRSPGDLARQIAPWSSRPIVGRPTLTTSLPVAADSEPTASVGAAPGGAGPAAEASVDSTPADTGTVPSAVPGPSVPPTVAAKAGPDSSLPDDAPLPSSPRTDAGEGPASAASTVAAAAAGAAAARAGHVGQPKGSPGSARTTTATRPVGPVAGPTVARTRPRLPTVVGDAPAPLVPAEPLTKDESKVALGIVAAFVLIALAIGINGVSKIGSNTNFDLSVGTKPTVSVSPSTSPTAAAAGPQPLAILSADGFDPQGDGRENGQAAPKVFDGDPATGWTTEGYKSAQLGGLKDGVGVILDLGPNVTPKKLNLVLGNTADLQVYSASARSLDGATSVAETAGATGSISLDLAPDKTAGRQYLIIWFTQLTEDDSGFYRAILNEVSVLG